MKPETLSKFKTLFEQQKQTLLFSQSRASEEFHVSKDEQLDEVDFTMCELETSMRIRLRNREALYLRKINEALSRIQSGCFGECEDCGDAIELKRLEARPTATLCVSCKEEQERLESGHIDGHRHKSLGFRLKFA